MSRTALAALVACPLGLFAPSARAHDFTPGVLSLVEREPGHFEYSWTAPVDSGVPLEVTVAFPAHCRRRGETRLDCGPAGLRGDLRFRGLRDHRARVVVVVDTLDGPPREHVVGGDDPHLSLDRSAGPSLLVWLRLGVEHIALGYDHLAFLLGLLLVAGAGRRALAAVTAFTLAHSLTLALATLDLVHLAAAPVEATIAASVVLVARESLREQPTLTRRAPWLVALVFGLVHGLGFAGALRGIGLPSGSIAAPLFGFNAGVELGQLVIVAIVVAAARLVTSAPRWLRPAAAYAIGAFGMAWLLARVLGIVTATS